MAVATYRRNDLLIRCIESIVAQIAVPSFDIVVIDNDPEQGAAALIADHFGEARHPPVQYVAEPEPGISAARNRAIDVARQRGSDWIAFIDDDETAAPDWLSRLTAAATKHDAAAVTGSVRAVLQPGGETWVRASDFEKPVPAPGAPMRVASTANILFRLDALEALDDGRPFEPTLGLTGGSDAHLTARLSRAGSAIIAEPRAVVTESIPATRQTLKWLSARRRRQAAGYVVVQRLVLRDRFWPANRLIACLKHFVVGVLWSLSGGLSGSVRRRRLGSISRARAAGILLGLMGRRVAEYER